MLIFLLLGLSLLSRPRLLVISLVLIVISLLIGWLFYRFEFKKTNPLINVKEVRANSKLSSYLLQTIAFGFASAVIFLLPPFIFEQLYHLGFGLTGFLVLGAPASLVIFSRVSGKLNDGSKNIFFSRLGLGIICLSLIFLLLLTPKWPYFLLTLGLFIYGIGGGYFQPANIASIMQASPIEMQGSAGALQRMAQNVAIASGSAIGATCLNLWPNNLLLATRVAWTITLILVIFSLKEMVTARLKK